jgi:hypothetical protein
MKVGDGELPEDADAGNTMDSTGEGVNGNSAFAQSDGNHFNSHQSGMSRRDGYQRNSKVVNEINVLLSW